MNAWFFRVILDRVSVSYSQTSEGDAPHNGKLLCRLVFDGKVVDLALPFASQHALKSKPVSFKYRIQARTLKDLAATFSQRTACFQIIRLNALAQQSDVDAHPGHGSVVGTAAIDLLSLARNVAAQYEFPLRVSELGSNTTSLNKLSVYITMEQICDFRLQLNELRASGLESGEYKLRYVLSSSNVEMRSRVVRSKLGSATWTDEILPELPFQGTLQALALRDFTLSVVKCGENGRETPISVFSLSLVKVHTNSYETVKEIPFLLEDVNSPTIISGVLRLSELPVFYHYIQYVSNPSRSCMNDEMRKKCKDSSAGVAVERSHDGASSNLNLPQLFPSAETAAGSVGREHSSLAELSGAASLSPLTQAGDQASVCPPLAEASENQEAKLTEGKNDASRDASCHVTPPLHERGSKSRSQSLISTIPSNENTSPPPPTPPPAAAAPHEQGKQDKCGSVSSSPLPGTNGGDAGGACEPSIHILSSTDDEMPAEREEHPATAPAADTLQRGEQQEEEEESKRLTNREGRILRELACLDERIEILQECLQNACVLFKSTGHNSAAQVAALEQQLSELDVAEAALRKLQDRLHERFRQCTEQYRKSESEFCESMRRLGVYADVLIDIDRRISAEIQPDEMEMPAPEHAETICHLPHPPTTPKPTRR